MYDLRLALRALRNSPLYALASIAIIALGIASSATVFTFVDGLLLRPLPFAEPDRLVEITKRDLVRGFDHYTPIYPEIVEWARSASGLESAAAIRAWGPSDGILTGSGEGQRIRIEFVSANFFDVVGVEAAHGRTFRSADDGATAVPPILLSDRLWRRRFGADVGIVGTAVPLEFQKKERFEVIGVLPKELDLGRGSEAWVPALAVHPDWEEGRGCECDAIARMRPGVSREQLRAELQTIHERMASEKPDPYRAMTVVVSPLLEVVVGTAGRASILLFGAVLVLVGLSAVNLAGLTLAHAARRKRLLALQLALGADRAALVRQRVVEGAILSAFGLAFGLLLASATVELVLVWKGVEIPRSEEIVFGARPVLFAFVTLAVTSLAAAVYPALSATRGDLARSLGARAVGAADRRATAFVVTAQIALAVVLLTGAGLLVRTLEAQQSIDRGLSAERLLSIRVDLPESRYATPEAHLSFMETLVSEIEGLPGIAAVTTMFMRPGSGNAGYSGSFHFEGQSVEEARSNPFANFEWIQPNYFRTLGIPVLQGRAFEERDVASGDRVAIVSRAMAEAYWPGQDPIGKTVGLPDRPRHRVVGVVADLRYRELTRSWQSVYFPIRQNPLGEGDLHPFGVPRLLAVRTAIEPDAVIASIRSTMTRMEPDLPGDGIATMESLFEKELAAPKRNAFLVSGFSLAATLLAAVGLYGLFAASVAERLPELGLRLALGATPARILRLVWRQVTRLASAGILAGLVLSLSLSSLVERFLFGVEPSDPLTYAFVAVFFSLVALGATYLPAKRASRADPLSLLRSA